MDWVGDVATIELCFTEPRQGEWSYGTPKEVARYANGGLDLEVFLSAIRIGGATFEESDEELSMSAQVGLAQTRLLQARFGQRELWPSGDVGVRIDDDCVFRQLEERILARQTGNTGFRANARATKEGTMKLNSKKTLVGICLAALVGASVVALAQSDSLGGKMDRRVGYYLNQGYTLTQTRSGDLEEGYGRSHYFTLAQGWEYRLVAVCDADCDDLDLALYDGDDREVDRDWEPDDIPLVSVRPRFGESYRLRVDMAACSLEPCGYRVAVMARRR